MTVLNFGSINIDLVYRVPHLPAPGETLVSTGYSTGLGGKGANQSIAIARAGGAVRHIGAIGPEGGWTLDTLRAAGADTAHVRQGEVPTGHAVIYVDDKAENSIVLFPGANVTLDAAALEPALASARAGDWFLLQNETSYGVEAARAARGRGLKVCYSAAPFEAAVVAGMLPVTDLLVVNEIEAAQLAAALGRAVADLPVAQVVVTLGAEGAVLYADGTETRVAAHRVEPVDTTGAGDTFLGYLLAGLDSGMAAGAAMARAAAASALQVTREGAAAAIPVAAEVAAFLEERG